MSCPTTVMSCPRLPADSVSRQLCGQVACRSSLFARAVHFVRRSWRVYWEWRARRATILLLRALDDRTLHDIGIAPSEIESLVQGGGHCRRYDAAWPWR
jgi:uncharacterized protein YjiS (DUF1127 family)